MFIIHGKRLAGKIDEFENEYAAINFAHIFWIPMFPISETFWITNKGTKGFSGYPIRWSFKSCFVAYGKVLPYFILLMLFSDQTSILSITNIAIFFLLLFVVLVSWLLAKPSIRELKKRRIFYSVTGFKCSITSLKEEISKQLEEQTLKHWYQLYPSDTPENLIINGNRSELDELNQLKMSYIIFTLKGINSSQDITKRKNMFDLANKSYILLEGLEDRDKALS